MPKTKTLRPILEQQLPVPNPPYSPETAKAALGMYLAYHAQTNSGKSQAELLADFAKQYQGTFSRLQDYVFKYISSPREVINRHGIVEETAQLYPGIPEIQQGPYSTAAPWDLFKKFADEWFHKTTDYQWFLSQESSVFLSLRPTKGFLEFHVFVK